MPPTNPVFTPHPPTTPDPPTTPGPLATTDGLATTDDLRAAINRIRLVDHHVHSVVGENLTEDELEVALTEAYLPPARPATVFDSQLGFAVRNWCAPLLDLPAFASPAAYVARRTELGPDEVNRRFLTAAGASDLLVDIGYTGDRLIPDAELARLSDTRVRTLLRLESVAERWVSSDLEGLASLDALLRESASSAVGFKSVAAYRGGLRLPAEPPAAQDVETALRDWRDIVRTQDTPPRLTDRTIQRHLIWWALRDGRPLQFHTGFGDPDLLLRDSDPLALQDLLVRAADLGGPVVLLHTYPFVRQAGYLAAVLPHVYFDVGLTSNHIGTSAVTAVREALELAPFGKLLYSSDGIGLPELTFLGARQWRTATTAVLTENMREHGWPAGECLRVAELIGHGNARAIYGLD
ncbi:amidohydrolase [Kineosporia sp. NBRC 101731]|nr:amidohydrolase [Kineosporia sp. NBRC 101731]